MLEREFHVGSGAGLNVKIQAGRVEVGQGMPGSIRIEVTTNEPDAIDIHQSGDTVYVSDNRVGRIIRGNVRVIASVPAGTDLEVGSASADVNADVDLGSFICRTASGDVWFQRADTVEIKTASGSVRGETAREDFRVNSASGDVYLDRVGGRLTAALASGAVRVGDVGGDLRANSASGDLRIDRFRGDDVVLKSVSGDLVIGFPKGTILEADINTLSGDVQLPSQAAETSSPDPGPAPERVDQRRRVRLNAKTVSGDIRISSFSA